MGKASKLSKHRDKVGKSSSVPYNSDDKDKQLLNRSQSTGHEDVSSDIASVDPSRRAKACYILASFFAQNSSANISYTAFCNDKLMGHLRARLMDSNFTVKVAATGVLRLNYLIKF